jgi:hypothetical protein
MCIINMPDTIILEQLQNALKVKEYHKWNLTSINNLAMIIQNNSSECKKLAIILLNEYIKFAENSNAH